LISLPAKEAGELRRTAPTGPVFAAARISILIALMQIVEKPALLDLPTVLAQTARGAPREAPTGMGSFNSSGQ